MPNVRLPPVSVGPRDPGNLPNIMGKLEALRVAVKSADPKVRAQFQAVFDSLEETCRVQTNLNRMLWFMRGSTPAKHGLTHTPYSGIDPLPISTPLGLANTNIKGTVNTFLGGGAQFKRDVRVKEASVDVATRNALNFVSGVVVADNPGSDQVDVTVVGDGGGAATVFSWFFSRVG